MSGLVLIACIIWFWNTAYRSGKRVGSRKGYGVGYSRGRRRRWR